MEINWTELKWNFFKWYEQFEDQVGEINWGIIGAVLFAGLLLIYIIDSLSGSQISPKFLIIAILALLALGIAAQHVVTLF